MNNPELYQDNNTLQRRDAEECLEENVEKLKWKNDGDTIIDIGCGDGSVTRSVLEKFLPYNYKKLVGCDISEAMVQFANAHHATDRTSFTVLDIAGHLPDELQGNFDHAFSFYTLHWVKDQETAFTNIYKMLADGGDCLLAFLRNTSYFEVYRIMARNPRWSHWVKDLDHCISPYHVSQDPEQEIRMMMTRIGFTNAEVKCIEKTFPFTSLEKIKNFIISVNTFKIPPEELEAYIEDFVKIYEEMQQQRTDYVSINENFNITFTYNLLVVYGKKKGMPCMMQCLEENVKKIKWKNDGDTIIDIGCGDGSVTSCILKKFLPYNYKKLVGCDISEEMVQFANAHHAADRTSFTVLDIAGHLHDELRGNFDHAFSFYSLHWIIHQKTAFTNIYELLTKGGHCLLMFLGHSPFYDVYHNMARTSRWGQWLKDVDRFVSPYHDSQDPEQEIKTMMAMIGFTDVEVKCMEKSFLFPSMEAMKNFVSAVNPFKIPPGKMEDYLDEFVRVYRHIQRIDHVDVNHITLSYHSLVVYGNK